jgi:hypothetical protein
MLDLTILAPRGWPPNPLTLVVVASFGFAAEQAGDSVGRWAAASRRRKPVAATPGSVRARHAIAPLATSPWSAARPARHRCAAPRRGSRLMRSKGGQRRERRERCHPPRMVDRRRIDGRRRVGDGSGRRGVEAYPRARRLGEAGRNLCACGRAAGAEGQGWLDRWRGGE